MLIWYKKEIGGGILYTIHQWLLLFYLYCFAGWIWESCYVSLKKRKWINRGFLKGPLLPIYGSGAIVVLVSTIMVQNNTFLIFIIGMIAATILEYITGELMERIFHVRYWDYSDKPFNINGHICLLSSLAWGIFSVLLVKITERNETVSVIKKRLEIVEAFINEDIKDLKGRILDKLEIQQERKSEKKTKKAMHIEAIIRKNLSITEEKIRGLSEKISLYMDKLEGVPFRGSEDTEHLKLEFKEYINKLRMHESRIHNTENNVYIKSIKILRRNPNAKAKKYEEAMNEVKNLDKELNDK